MIWIWLMLCSSSSSSSALPLQSLQIAELLPLAGSGLLNLLGSNPEPYAALTHLDLTFIPSGAPSLAPVAEALKGLAARQNLGSLRLKCEVLGPLVQPLQQLTNVTRLGLNWVQRSWVQELPANLQVGSQEVCCTYAERNKCYCLGQWG
jgi:hypothetical protein